MNPDDLLTIGDGVVARARPGEDVEAVVSWSRETEVRVYDGETEQFVSSNTAGVGVRVVVDGKVGFAYAGTLEQSAVAEALDEARDNAGFATRDPNAGVALPDGVAEPAIDLFDSRMQEWSSEQKIALAVELERLVRSGDPRIVGLDGGADYADATAYGAVVSTAGIRAAAAETACTLSVYSLASADDDTTVGFGCSVGRFPGELDVERTANEAVERAVRVLGARPVPTQRLTVVLDPWVSAQFLGLVAETFSGDAVLKGRSLFAARLGEHVASPLVTLVDDPTDARAWGASTTDGEGLACRRTVLIDAGRAANFLHDSTSARAMRAVSTASAVRAGYRSTPSAGPQAVALVPGSQTPEEILAGVELGVLVQEVSGLHSGVNPVSGDFSTGAEGVMIRDGEVAEPVREVTIASTLQRMLSDTVAVGSDLTVLPFEASGVTMAIADVTLSGA